MKNKRKGFLFIAFGMLFLMFNFTKEFYWFKTHFTVDLIPDPVGYIFICIGLFILGAALKTYRTAAIFSLAGVILSTLGVWKYSSEQTPMILQCLAGAASIGTFCLCLSGVKKTAKEAGETALYGRARLTMWIYFFVCLGKTFSNYAFLGAAPLEPGLLVSLSVILFGALEFAVLAYMVYLLFVAFSRLGDALEKMWDEKF